MIRHNPVFLHALVVAVLLAAVATGCMPPPGSNSSIAPPSASSSSAGAASPSATPKAFVTAIAAFVDRVASGKLSYRVAFKGIMRASADTLPIRGRMDVSGADFASSFTYDATGEFVGRGKIPVQVRAVRGNGYIKRDSAAWRPAKAYAKSQSFIPFKAVRRAADVRFLGDVKVGKATLHKVGVPGAVLIHPNTIPGLLQKEKIDLTELEVLIDDAGRPRSGTWRLWGQGRVGPGIGQLQRIVYELDLSFARVGKKVSIKRP